MLSTTNSGTILETFQDNQIAISGSADKTKVLKFDCSTIPTATTVTIKAPTTSGNALVDSITNLSITNSGTSGQVLTSLGTNSASFQTPAGGSGITNINQVVIAGTANSSGSAVSTTYTPTAGLVGAMVEIVGSGAAGGGCPTGSGTMYGCGGGGGAGGYGRAYFSGATLLAASPITVTIPAGGTTSTGAGNVPSGSTTFGSFMNASAPSGGAVGVPINTGVNATAGGAGASVTITGATGNVFAQQGGFGEAGCSSVAGQITNGGGGGASHYGTGGTNSASGTPNGLPRTGFGWGGGGAGNFTNASSFGGAQSGTAGCQGLVIITEYL